MSRFNTEALIGGCAEGLSSYMYIDNQSASPNGALPIHSRGKLIQIS